MVYLFESKLPENKSIYFGLTCIFGISKSSSFLICKKLGFLSNLKVKKLSTDQILEISKIIESMSFLIANDLKRYNLLKKQKLFNIKSYKGLRRKKGFPVRGQRTHTNAKTAKKIR
uniref:ribosomal protein S13 n=1 Tax=Navicula tsukamotoi TaxID=2018706 RepID=UPI00202894B2|nr:ribosomal protein S13 [Navicula tsukamotoi]QYB23121.1 ribosomal protein S13 [Navicula tsukamotoi]